MSSGNTSEESNKEEEKKKLKGNYVFVVKLNKKKELRESVDAEK